MLISVETEFEMTYWRIEGGKNLVSLSAREAFILVSNAMVDIFEWHQNHRYLSSFIVLR